MTWFVVASCINLVASLLLVICVGTLARAVETINATIDLIRKRLVLAERNLERLERVMK